MALKIFGSSPSSLWNSAKKTVSKTVGGSSGSKSKKSGSNSTGSVKKTSKTSKSSTSQKYLTNAPALYSAFGKKVTTTSTSAYSTGRPAESYAPVRTSNANKTKKVTKKKSPSVKKASWKTSSKKGTAKKSTVKTSKGKGIATYGGKIKANGFMNVASYGSGFIPTVGDAKDIQEALTGRDVIAGKKLSTSDQIITGVAAVLPVVSGPMLKSAGKGVKIAG